MPTLTNRPGWMPRAVAGFFRRSTLSYLSTDTLAGRVTWRLLAVSVVLPPLGAVCEEYILAQGFPVGWHVVLFAALQMIVLGVVSIYVGRLLAASEKQRNAAERERTTALRQLERQAALLQNEVARRTAEFSQTLLYNQQLALVASNTDNAAIISDAHGQLEWANEAFTRLTGYTLEEASGRRLSELLHGECTDPLGAALLRTGIETGEPRTTELVLHARDGHPFWAAIEQQPVRGPQGDLRGFITIGSDISARKAAEERVLAAKMEAEQLNSQLEIVIGQAQQSATEAHIASQAKSAFLATMSHEIRTPLNGIIGMAGLLRDTGLDARQMDFVRTIETSGDALLTIINDVLDYSKIEAGRIDLESAPFDLRQCVEDALDLFAAKSAEKKLELLSRFGPGVPSVIVGDVTRLRQIIVNLIGNALKFTAKGEVVVSLEATPQGGGRHEVHCVVRDTGIGIPADRRDRLFQPFSQIDSSTTRKYGGTGLGLAISRRLAEAMGGRMWVESEANCGSEFHFTLLGREEPIGVQARWQVSPAPALEGRHLLVVDDNASARAWLAEHLVRWGVRVQFAESTGAALDHLRSDAPCDLALVDWQMPGADVDALGGEIHGLPGREKLPLVLMSSLASNSAAEVFAGQTSKPLKPGSLFDALQRVLVRSEPAAVPAPVVPAVPPGGSHPALSLMLVEDNPVNQRVALMMLGKLGYEVRVANNGAEAVAAFTERACDVILMDMEMPVMDGCEATRQIRGLATATRPWIVALTANAMNADRQRAMNAGMNDFVPKPIRLTDLSGALTRAAHGLQLSPDEVVPAA